jgi:transcriptional regulator with XRE-family HTH domain
MPRAARRNREAARPSKAQGAARPTQRDFHAVRLESARRAFPSDARVAEALGVDRAQVKRWREGRTTPGRENADRIVGLDAAIELLSDWLEPGSIAKWLTGFNAHLGDRRPLDLLREGNLSDVIAAIEALKSGSYA